MYTLDDLKKYLGYTTNEDYSDNSYQRESPIDALVENQSLAEKNAEKLLNQQEQAAAQQADLNAVSKIVAPVKADISSISPYPKPVNIAPTKADISSISPYPKTTEPQVSLPGSSMIKAAARYSSPSVQSPVSSNISPGSFKFPETPDYEKMLELANQLKGNQQLVSGLGKAGAQIGAAIAGATQKQDYSLFDDQLKNAGQYGEQVKSLQDTRRNKLKEQKEMLDLEDEAKMTDPNSDISKALREGAKMLGLNVSDKTSGRDLRNSGINLGTILSAKLQREQTAESKAARLDAKERDRVSSNDQKFISTLNDIDKKYIDSTKEIAQARALAESATESPTAAVNLARGLIKAIEGSGARVSDKDIQTTLRAGGVPQEMIAWIQNKAEGTLPEFQQEDVINLIHQMENIHKNKFDQLKNLVSYRHDVLTQRKPGTSLNMYQPSLDTINSNNVVQELTPRQKRIQQLKNELGKE